MSKNRMVAGVLAIALASLVCGCSTSRHESGTTIKDESVQQIVKGKTAMEEIIALFGEPVRATPMGDDTIYTYEYRVSRSQTMFFPYVASGDSKDEVDKLSIVFDNKKIVKTYNLTRGVGK